MNEIYDPRFEFESDLDEGLDLLANQIGADPGGTPREVASALWFVAKRLRQRCNDLERFAALLPAAEKPDGV